MENHRVSQAKEFWDEVGGASAGYHNLWTESIWRTSPKPFVDFVLKFGFRVLLQCKSGHSDRQTSDTSCLLSARGASLREVKPRKHW